MMLIATSFAQKQKEPILGTWYFDLDKKITQKEIVSVAHDFGFDTTSVQEMKIANLGLGILIISRCEFGEIFFSPFENNVMITTKPTYFSSETITEWGKWKKINKRKYVISFENRPSETYIFDKKRKELFYQKNQYNLNYMSELIDNNLKLIRKK